MRAPYFDTIPFFVSHDTASNTMHASRLVINAGIDPYGYQFYSGTFYPSNTGGTGNQFMKVDYFNYWKLKLDCGASLSILDSTALANYYIRGTAAIKHDITFGDGSHSLSLNSGGHYVFRAVDSITIDGSFTVPSGTEFTVVPTPCH